MTASCPSSRARSSGWPLITCPATATRSRCGCGGHAPAPRQQMRTGCGRRSCAVSISSTPSGCSSRSSAGPPPRSATPAPLTGGPGSSSPAMPSCASPGSSPAICAAPGRNPPRRAGSPRPASAAGLGTSARRPPLRPAHRNPANPDPAGPQARRTAARPPATTSGKTLKRTCRRGMSRTRKVKRQAKGAMLSSRSLMWQYVSCIIDGGMDGDDVEVHAMPLYHCAQLDCFLGPDMYLGATSIVLPAPDPAAVLAAIESQRATKLFCPPTVWIGLLRSPEFGQADLSSLRKGYYGASAMPVEVLRELQERLPGIRLWNFYGQTEMAPLATILGPDEQVSRAGSAGRAALNVETRLVDDNDLVVPPGTVGEIVHRSPHATLGYYKDEAMTAAAFRNGWFHSGDLGAMTEDGYLTIVDRKKDMIKTGGENVASREVEETIYQMDGVAEAAVFGVAHPRGVEAVVAVVVPKPGTALTGEAVIRHTRQVLAGYKTPKRVVIAGALPKNPSGKILKRQLREEHKDIAADT